MSSNEDENNASFVEPVVIHRRSITFSFALLGAFLFTGFSTYTGFLWNLYTRQDEIKEAQHRHDEKVEKQFSDALSTKADKTALTDLYTSREAQEYERRQHERDAEQDSNLEKEHALMLRLDDSLNMDIREMRRTKQR